MNWYTVHIRPRQEYVAELSLHRLGIEVFYPQIKENRVVRRKRKPVICPLFPGYFFARFNVETCFRAVNYAHGVRTVITYGSTPVAVDESVIIMIKSRLKESYIVLQKPSFNPGQTVRIQSGTFEGLDAVFEREMTAQHRVVLLLKTLTYQPHVVVDRECIEAQSSRW